MHRAESPPESVKAPAAAQSTHDPGLRNTRFGPPYEELRGTRRRNPIGPDDPGGGYALGSPSRVGGGVPSLLELRSGEDLLKFVGEGGERGAVRGCGGRCRESASRVGFLLAQRLQAHTMAPDALMAISRRKGALLEGFEVALQLLLEVGDLGAG